VLEASDLVNRVDQLPSFLQLFTPMIENERDCFTKICEALLRCGALTVCARYFGTVGDMRWAVLLDNGGEFVLHACILALGCVIYSDISQVRPWLR